MSTIYLDQVVQRILSAFSFSPYIRTCNNEKHRNILCLLPFILSFHIQVCTIYALSSTTCPNIVWNDEFNGNTLDTSRWRVRHGDGCQYGFWMCGWGNHEQQYYTQDSIIVSNGLLKINVKQDFWPDGNERFTSGRIESISRDHPLPIYGRFEAKMKFPVDNGIWPAFWMLPVNNTYGPWPKSGELDIMENIGYRPKRSESCVHWGNGIGNKHKYKHGLIDILDGSQLNSEFHRFAIEKEKDEVRFYVNDVLFYSRTKEEIGRSFIWPFNEEFMFIINVAIGWPKLPQISALPTVMEIDYVRVWDQPTPSISGPKVLHFYDKNRARFEIQNAYTDSEFVWRLPEGASLVEGSGTNAIIVDFKSVEGIVNISCSIISLSCGENVIQQYVDIVPGLQIYGLMLIIVILNITGSQYIQCSRKKTKLKRGKDSSLDLCNSIELERRSLVS